MLRGSIIVNRVEEKERGKRYINKRKKNERYNDNNFRPWLWIFFAFFTHDIEVYFIIVAKNITWENYYWLSIMMV